VVDRDGLENRCACKRTVGSNPTLSAILAKWANKTAYFGIGRDHSHHLTHLISCCLAASIAGRPTLEFLAIPVGRPLAGISAISASDSPISAGNGSVGETGGFRQFSAGLRHFAPPSKRALFPKDSRFPPFPAFPPLVLLAHRKDGPPSHWPAWRMPPGDAEEIGQDLVGAQCVDCRA
jgi:hypothetical protein